MGFYEIHVREQFSAAHALREYQGDCARLHGHNWSVELCVKCSDLDKIGIGIDFRELKKMLKEVIGKLDHQNLNEISEFQDLNPTSENIAKFIFRALKEKVQAKGAKIARVTTSESTATQASYWEE